MRVSLVGFGLVVVLAAIPANAGTTWIFQDHLTSNTIGDYSPYYWDGSAPNWWVDTASPGNMKQSADSAGMLEWVNKKVQNAGEFAATRMSWHYDAAVDPWRNRCVGLALTEKDVGEAGDSITLWIENSGSNRNTLWCQYSSCVNPGQPQKLLYADTPLAATSEPYFEPVYVENVDPCWLVIRYEGQDSDPTRPYKYTLW